MSLTLWRVERAAGSLARKAPTYSQRGVRERKQPALTLEPLEALLATCQDTPQDVRDRRY